MQIFSLLAVLISCASRVRSSPSECYGFKQACLNTKCGPVGHFKYQQVGLADDSLNSHAAKICLTEGWCVHLKPSSHGLWLASGYRVMLYEYVFYGMIHRLEKMLMRR